MQYPNRRAVNAAIGLSLVGLCSARPAARCPLPAAARGVIENIGSYPSRPITIVVGFPPGGATDIIARLVATKLSQAWGKPVIVENKAGAGSNIATGQVVRADPDGYTLLAETIANATNMSVYRNLNYDTQKDLF